MNYGSEREELERIRHKKEHEMRPRNRVKKYKEIQ